MGCCIGRAVSSVPDSEEELPIAVGKSKQLIKHRLKWKSDIAITEGQLQGKRDEFWDTAPAFEGRKEIWDALRAAASSAENGDYLLAQAILDGANISLPDGTIRESYDELGCRYQIPIYCLSRPLNLIEDPSASGSRRSSSDAASVSASVAVGGQGAAAATAAKKSLGHSLTVKLRLSTTGQDIKMEVRTNETVKMTKKRLHSTLEQAVASYHHQRWYFGGRLLTDKMKIHECRVPANCVIQVVLPYVSPNTTTVIPTAAEITNISGKSRRHADDNHHHKSNHSSNNNNNNEQQDTATCEQFHAENSTVMTMGSPDNTSGNQEQVEMVTMSLPSTSAADKDDHSSATTTAVQQSSNGGSNKKRRKRSSAKQQTSIAEVTAAQGTVSVDAGTTTINVE